MSPRIILLRFSPRVLQLFGKKQRECSRLPWPSLATPHPARD